MTLKGPMHIFILVANENKRKNLIFSIILNFLEFFFQFFIPQIKFMAILICMANTYRLEVGMAMGWV